MKTLTSTLRVFDEAGGMTPLRETQRESDIARELAAIGVRFERWSADADLPRDADEQTIFAAYAGSIATLEREGGYASKDVIRLAKGTPNTEPMRAKFLNEHQHSEDEVRFFVEGSGAFYLHANGAVYQAICVRGDLISVPAGTKHWFDMGPDPEFTAIRLFTNPDGWVANFTGDSIAARFPKYE